MQSLYLGDVPGRGGCARLLKPGEQTLPARPSAPGGPSRRRPARGPTGGVSGGCRERGATGVGAAAAVATGENTTWGEERGEIHNRVGVRK